MEQNLFSQEEIELALNSDNLEASIKMLAWLMVQKIENVQRIDESVLNAKTQYPLIFEQAMTEALKKVSAKKLSEVTELLISNLDEDNLLIIIETLRLQSGCGKWNSKAVLEEIKKPLSEHTSDRLIRALISNSPYCAEFLELALEMNLRPMIKHIYQPFRDLYDLAVICPDWSAEIIKYFRDYALACDLKTQIATLQQLTDLINLCDEFRSDVLAAAKEITAVIAKNGNDQSLAIVLKWFNDLLKNHHGFSVTENLELWGVFLENTSQTLLMARFTEISAVFINIMGFNSYKFSDGRWIILRRMLGSLMRDRSFIKRLEPVICEIIHNNQTDHRFDVSTTFFPSQTKLLIYSDFCDLSEETQNFIIEMVKLWCVDQDAINLQHLANLMCVTAFCSEEDFRTLSGILPRAVKKCLNNSEEKINVYIWAIWRYLMTQNQRNLVSNITVNFILEMIHRGRYQKEVVKEMYFYSQSQTGILAESLKNMAAVKQYIIASQKNLRVQNILKQLDEVLA